MMAPVGTLLYAPVHAGINAKSPNSVADKKHNIKLKKEQKKQIYLTLNGVVEMKDGSIQWK